MNGNDHNNKRFNLNKGTVQKLKKYLKHSRIGNIVLNAIETLNILKRKYFFGHIWFWPEQAEQPVRVWGTLFEPKQDDPEYSKLLSQVQKYNQQLIARDESRKKVGSFQIYLSSTSNRSSFPSLHHEPIRKNFQIFYPRICYNLSRHFESHCEAMDCPNFKAKKKSSNFLRSAKFEKFRNTFSIFWRNHSKGYFPWQDSITWHRF